MKQVRKAARALLKTEAPLIAESFLGGRSVGMVTAVKYANHLTWMEGWLNEAGILIDGTSPRHTDQILARYMDFLFFEGEEYTKGQYTLAATVHRWPSLGEAGKKSLPLARQALKGWKKLCPGKTRLPLPWLLAASMAALMVQWGHFSMGLLTVITFHTYMRPGVAIQILWKQVIPPVPAGEGFLSLWTLVLHMSELGQPSKTGGWDETLHMADVPRWAWLAAPLSLAWVTWRRSGLPAEIPLADFTMAQWTNICRLALEHLQVPPRVASEFVLYMFRHGGAADDLASQSRPLMEIKKRGAWRTDSSVARYSKSARLNQQVMALSRRCRERAGELLLLLPSLLSRKC